MWYLHVLKEAYSPDKDGTLKYRFEMFNSFDEAFDAYIKNFNKNSDDTLVARSFYEQELRTAMILGETIYESRHNSHTRYWTINEKIKEIKTAHLSNLNHYEIFEDSQYIL